MRLISGRINPKRPRARGVAAIEFALLLPFIAVIVLALVDYGYYFYVGINATEAARAAAVVATTTAAALNGGTGPTSCNDTNANIGQVKNAYNGSPVGQPELTARNYMTNQVSATIGGNTTASVNCANVGSSPIKYMFSIQVTVTFAPPSGTVHFGLPRSGNNLVYTTKTLWRWY